MNLKSFFGTARAVFAVWSVAALAMLCTSSAHAALSLGWTGEAMDAEGKKIHTEGTFLWGVACGGTKEATGEITVNGVTFTTILNTGNLPSSYKLPFTLGHGLTMNLDTAGDAGVTDADYAQMMNKAMWRNNYADGLTYTMKDLTVGKTYLVQLVFHRTKDKVGEFTVNGETSVSNGGTDWTYGGTLVGVFQATAATYTFTISCSLDAYQQLNAIQLREVDMKSPSFDTMTVSTNNSTAVVSLSGVYVGTDDSGAAATKYTVNWELSGAAEKSGTVPDQSAASATFSVEKLDNGNYDMAVWITNDKGKVSATNTVPFKISVSDSKMPILRDPVVSFGDNGSFTISVEIDGNMPSNGTVKAACGGITNNMATLDTAVPATYSTVFTTPVDTTIIAEVSAKSEKGYAYAAAPSAPFYNGEIKIEKIRDASEYGRTNGAIRISRKDSSHDLAVNVTVDPSSTAVAGVDYEPFATNVTIAAGSSSVTISVTPKFNVSREDSPTVVVKLTAGNYRIGTASSVSLNIVNCTPDGNTWAASAAGKASVASNWSYGAAPTPADTVYFDAEVSGQDCEWDASAARLFAGMELRANYTGTVAMGENVNMTTLKFTGENSVLDLRGMTVTVSHVYLQDTELDAGEYTSADNDIFGTSLKDSVGGGKLVVAGDGLWIFVQ